MQKLGKGWVALVLWLGACGGAFSGTSAGGESHFLRRCFEGCGNLECVADICTRSCVVGKSGCGDLATRATCTNASVEPGLIAVCDLSCTTKADCSQLGKGYACEQGFCRSTTRPPDAMGEAGTSSGSGSNGGASPSDGSSASAGTSPSAGEGNDPARCALPFDAGPCKAKMPVFAVNGEGKCYPTFYGGCDGNANRFKTYEECAAVCQHRPSALPCGGANLVEKEICLECGPAGGCELSMNVCAQYCNDTDNPCVSTSLRCVDGICQAAGCF